LVVHFVCALEMETEREKMEGYCVWRLGSLRRMREREGRLVGSSDSEMA
jgi:hypothetical protein